MTTATDNDMIECPCCDGKGIADLGCNACGGSGEGMADGSRCHVCRGRGAYDGECPDCYGSGVIVAPVETQCEDCQHYMPPRAGVGRCDEWQDWPQDRCEYFVGV